MSLRKAIVLVLRFQVFRLRGFANAWAGHVASVCDGITCSCSDLTQQGLESPVIPTWPFLGLSSQGQRAEPRQSQAALQAHAGWLCVALSKPLACLMWGEASPGTGQQGPLTAAPNPASCRTLPP